MSGIPKYAARRDGNEEPIITTAKQLGWYLVQTKEPGDWLGILKSRVDRGWQVIEIKTPKGKFKRSQLLFQDACKVWGLPYLVWRTAEDVVLQTNALRSQK
jgi:hypothetical protein